MLGVDLEAILKEREATRDRIYERANENPGDLHKTYWPWGEAEQPL